MQHKYTGTICAPSRYRKEACLTDRYALLLESLARKLNWKLLFADNIRRPKLEGNTLFLFKIPINERRSPVLPVNEIPPQMKVICYMTDLQINQKQYGYRYIKNCDRMFKRADIILCPNVRSFYQRWQKYFSKLIFFPHFIAPTSRYKRLTQISHQTKKALLIGLIGKKEYPFRLFLRQLQSDLIEEVPHPGDRFDVYERLESGYKIRDAYAETINQYVCAIASSSRYHYVLGKHFEIPASNSILLANEIPELAKCGFMANEHYIPISKKNAREIIEDVTQNSWKYSHIRENARNLVFSRHTIEHRIEQIIQMVS